MRDPETGNSRGFGFISYDSFEASDAAIEVNFLSNVVLVLAEFIEGVLGRNFCKYGIEKLQ